MTSWWVDLWRSVLHHELGFGASELRAGHNLGRSTGLDALELAPGSVVVRFADRGQHTARLTVAALTEQQQELMLQVAADHPALLVGVIIGELPAAYDAHWREAGISLVPLAADVSLDCSCDDWSERCRHLAGLGEMLAKLIEHDPFALLTLRSWGREGFVDGLRRIRADALGVPFERSDLPRGNDPGVDAGRRFARSVAPMPALRPVPRRAGSPRSLPSPPIDAGLDRSAIEALISDAAARAVAVLSEGAVSGLHLDLDADTARRAATLLGDRAALELLASKVGHDPDKLEVRATAWSVGGVAGLAACDATWSASPEQLAPGQRALGGHTRIASNVVFGGDTQLRLDPDGLWWRFRADDRLGWLLESGGLADPDDL